MLKINQIHYNKCHVSKFIYIFASKFQMSANNVKAIYKSLLRYGNTLKYSNKDYFYRRVRFEFEKNSLLEIPEEINFQIRKATKFLETKSLV